MSNKEQDSTKTRRGMGTLGQRLGRVAGNALRRRGFAEASIITDWATIVGRALAENSQPSRIVFPRGTRSGGTLHLRVSGAFAPEVQHLAPQIIERINGHFGYGAVARIDLHHGFTPPPPAQAEENSDAEPDASVREAIARITDPAVAGALERLARARARARAPARPRRSPPPRGHR